MNVFFIGKRIGDEVLTHKKDPDLHKRVVKSAEWISLSELKKLDFRPRELLERIAKDRLDEKGKDKSKEESIYFIT